MTIESSPSSDEQLSPLERLEALCDPGSLTLIRSDVRSRRMGDQARAGDGVIAGAGRVDGRPVFCYAQDPSYRGRLARRAARRLDRRACCASPAAPARRSSASSSPAARACRRASRRSRGYARIFQRARRALGQGPADLGDLRRVAPAAAPTRRR